MLSTNEFLIIAGVTIWILGLFGGLLPLCCTDVSPKLMSVLHMFAAGIFMAASIMHLLPDAVQNEQLSQLGCVGDETDECEEGDLWAFFFFGLGFLLILCLEQFARALQNQLSNDPPKDKLLVNVNTPLKSNFEDLEYSDIQLKRVSQVAEYFNSGLKCSSRTSICSVTHAVFDESPVKTQLVTMVVFISLSFHSIMEGVAIGSQVRPAWDIFLAIVAHKALAGFALGMDLQSHDFTGPRFFFGVLLFSLMTPVGIYLGWLSISEIASSSDQGEESAISGICTATSGGTFLFIAAMEIVPQELQDGNNIFLKSAALCLGFGLFGALAIWV